MIHDNKTSELIKQNDVFKVLLVIDLQKQFKDKSGQYEKCVNFIKEHFNDYYVVGSLFRNYDDSMYEQHLGWSECKDVIYNYSGISPDVEYPYHKLLCKADHYGINANGVLDGLDICKAASEYTGDFMPKIKYYLIGCDADACVMASAFELWDRRYDFEILTDYIYTNAEEFSLEDVIKIMRRNFGNCVK